MIQAHPSPLCAAQGECPPRSRCRSWPGLRRRGPGMATGRRHRADPPRRSSQSSSGRRLTQTSTPVHCRCAMDAASLAAQETGAASGRGPGLLRSECRLASCSRDGPGRAMGPCDSSCMIKYGQSARASGIRRAIDFNNGMAVSLRIAVSGSLPRPTDWRSAATATRGKAKSATCCFHARLHEFSFF